MTKYDFSGCIEIPEPFSLGLTLLSGQCFRWDGPDHTGYFNGVVDQKVIRLKQVGNRLFYDVIGNKMNSTKVVEAWLMSYFRFNDPLEKWYRDFQVIPIMRQAALALHGMRVLRQDPWECAISFMCAQGLSVEIIRIVIQNLCEKHGELIADTNSQTFPSIQKISEQNAVFFRRCTNNYLNRADRMIRFARCLLNDVFQLDHLRNISNEQARFFLTLFDGIGPKIADCILLFSLDHLAAFPIDRWVLRASSRRR